MPEQPRTYHYASRIYVTFAVAAADENAAFAQLNDTAIEVAAVGDPACRGGVRLTDVSVDGNPNLLPGLIDRISQDRTAPGHPPPPSELAAGGGDER